MAVKIIRPHYFEKDGEGFPKFDTLREPLEPEIKEKLLKKLRAYPVIYRIGKG